jgi:transcription elongation GreA/GreB family factor
MSRAFVKEQEDNAPETLPDLPQSPHPNYVTPGGFAQLKERLVEAQERRRHLQQAPDAATDPIKRSAILQIERDIRFLEGRLDRAILVDLKAQPHDEVAFGATVTVADDEGHERDYKIVGEDEADVEHGKVSWVSPLARALMGAQVGDVRTWRRPAGDVRLEVVGIHYEG